MAQTVTVSASLVASYTPTTGTARNANAAIPTTSFPIVASAPRMATAIVQNVGTSEEALNKGDCTSFGWVMIKNLDPTNFVTLRSVTATAGSAFAKLLAGEGLLIPSRQTNIYAIADTAACDVEITPVDA